jgi:hypothetical protein
MSKLGVSNLSNSYEDLQQALQNSIVLVFFYYGLDNLL